MSIQLRARPQPGLGSAAVGKDEEALVLDVLRRQELFRYYGNDPRNPPPMAATLEREACALFGVKYALAVTSGTAALEVAMAAAGIGPGDEVIIPGWSWISCFTSVVRCGARPVLAEVDESLCIAPTEITRLVTERTRGVMVVHYQGASADMNGIMTAASKHNLIVIEDCAEAPGATYKGKRLGSIGQVGIYSFQHNKPMTAGEGGMVVTSDPKLYERAVRMHDAGQYRQYHTGVLQPQEASFAGGQYRMSELTAAVALAQLRKLDAIRDHCRVIKARILERTAHLPRFTPRKLADDAGDYGFELYFYVPDTAEVAAFRQKLDARNVWCQQRTGTYPQYRRDYVISGLAAHPQLSPFRGIEPWPAVGYRAEDFPITEDLTSRFVAVPIGWRYTLEDADYIADCICSIYSEIFGAK